MVRINSPRYFFAAGVFLFTVGSLAQPAVPVDPLTGRAQVTIPIWELNDGPLSAPVALVYNSGGIKVQDREGHAGMGWNLAAGGAVVREVRGLPDDYLENVYDATDQRKGWLYGTLASQVNAFTSSSDNNLANCSDELTDFTWIRDVLHIPLRDGEPDVFTFNAPGLSGQFVFGADKLPKLIPYQDLKIEFTQSTSTSPIIQFKITRNDGTIYTFGTGDYITRQARNYYPLEVSQLQIQKEMYSKPLRFNASWYLTSIQSPTGHSITFSYSDEKVSVSKRDIKVAYMDGSTYKERKQYFVEDIVNRKDLISITAGAQKVDISWLFANQLISKISVTDRVLGDIKEFEIKYLPVRNSADALGSYARRFLKEIFEQGPLCQRFPAYQFEYYDVEHQSGWYYGVTSMPFQNDTIKQDRWGYFNNAASSRAITLHYYANKVGAERYRYYTIPGQTPTATINGGANRDVTGVTAKYGSLKKIHYPTGGEVELAYEPNDYFDAEANLDNYGPGLRVSMVTVNENITNAPSTLIQYSYKTADNKSSGKWVYRSVFGYHDATRFHALRDDYSPEPIIMYERTSVSQYLKGQRVYEYLLPGSYPSTTASPDWNATAIKVARNTGCASAGSIQNGSYFFPFAPNTNFGFERGLLSRIADYDAGNLTTPIHEKIFSYQRLNTASGLGKTVKGIRFEELDNTDLNATTRGTANIYVFGLYTLLTNENKVMLTETERTRDQVDINKIHEASQTYTFNSSHYLLQHLTQQNADGKTYKTRYRYAKDFANLTNPDGDDVPAQMIKKLNDDFRHGSVIETIQSVVDGSETVTGATVTLYGNFADSLATKTFALPVETRIFNGTTGFAESTVVPASGSDQQFQISSAYQPASYIKEYDFKGNPMSFADNQRNASGVHLGFKSSIPVAEISNALANEVTYNGFETYTGRELKIVPGGPQLNRPAGRTGRKALEMISTTVLERAVAKGKGRYYRYSCYVTGSSSGQLTFKVLNGITLVSSASAAYTGGTGWQFFSGRLDLDGLTTGQTITLRVESNATLTVDDITIYPESASVATYTYDPLFGRTSVSDSRGNSVVNEYDELGRLRYVKDQDRNIRQVTDYHYYAQPYPQLNATFSSSHEQHQVVKGSIVQYTAGFNCESPVEHDWYVDGVLLGDNTTSFQHTFNTTGLHTLTHRVTHLSLGSIEYPITYDVKDIGSGAIQVSLAPSGGSSYAYCDASHTKTFTATFSGCHILQDVTREWYVNVGSGFQPLSGLNPNSATLSSDDLVLTFDPVVAFNGTGQMAAYTVRCVATTVCPSDGKYYTHTRDVVISYNGNTQCN